jgi:hypothetical protein
MSMMTELTPLNAISPLDGRYWRKVSALADYSSEQSLFKHRVHVEVEYFIALVRATSFVRVCRKCCVWTTWSKRDLRRIYDSIGAADCARSQGA